MHRLLARQLQRHLPQRPPELLPLLNAVDEAYRAFDDDRLLVERALELSSQELLHANAETRALVAAVPDALVRLTRDGTIVELRGGFVPGFCRDRRQCAGNNLRTLFPPGATTAMLAAIDVAHARADVAMATVHFARPDGGTVWLDVRIVPLLAEQFLMIARDVTADRTAAVAERQRGEMVALRHAALHRLTTTGDPAAPARRDDAVRVVAEMLDLSRASVWLYRDERRAIECVALIDEGAATPVDGLRLEAVDFPRYFDAIRTSRTVAANDAHVDPRTSEFTDAYLVPLGIGAMLDVPIRVRGEVLGVLCCEHRGGARVWSPDDESFASSVADVVAQQLAAEQQRALEHQLQQSQKVEAVGLLAGGIAHDFNNLLTVILGYAEVIRMQAAAGSTLADDATEICTAAERASAMTKQLLALSRSSVPAPRVVALGEVVENIVPMLQRLVGAHIAICTETPDAPLHVTVDVAQVEQLLLNLVVNARDAMPRGGEVVIRVARGAWPHGVAAGRGDQPVVLTVRDNGDGMPDDVRQRVFEPFFTTKGAGKGTGLGLAIVQSIVRQAGGSVDIDSAPGAGTAVHVSLPEARPPEGTGTSSSGPSASQFGHGTIVVVEDEAPIRRLASEVLRQAGFDIIAAADGAEALQRLADAPQPDLLLSDVVMPGLSGPDLYAALLTRWPTLSAVFVSGNPQGIATTLEGTTATRFLQKPFSPTALVNLVAELLTEVRSA